MLWLSASAARKLISEQGVAAAFAYLVGGLLLDRTGPRVAFVAAGAAGLLATGATALALRRGAN